MALKEDEQGLHNALTNAGIPVVSVSNVDCSARTATVVYDPSATPAQIAQGNVIVSEWDCHRGEAIYMLDNLGDAWMKLQRAAAAALLDELNLHAQKVNAILNAIDGAATFAAMKTAIAAIPDYPQRTMAQVAASIKNKINGGEVP